MEVRCTIAVKNIVVGALILVISSYYCALYLLSK